MKKKLILKRITLVIFMAAIAGLFIWALQPQPVPVDTATVIRGPMRVTIDEEGETRVRRRFTVSAPQTGRLLRIDLDPGDAVRAGAAVAALLPVDPSLLDLRTRLQAEARVRTAESFLGQTQAQQELARQELAFARTQLDRRRELAEHGLVALELLQSAELEVGAREETLHAAQAAVETARYELEGARAALAAEIPDRIIVDPAAAVSIRSPVDGVVLRRLRDSEAIVAAGEPLLEVGNPADLEIVADFLSTDAVRIRPGQGILIEQWGGEYVLRGVVRRVEPSGFTKASPLGIEEQRVNVIADFADSEGAQEAWASLGDGYRLDVKVIAWESEDAIKAPASALFREGGEWAVFTVSEGRAALRPVQIGQRNGFEAEILSGLADGDVVIVHPSDSVVDGVEVAPRQ